MARVAVKYTYFFGKDKKCKFIGFAVNYYKGAFLVKCRVYKLNIVWWSGRT